MPLHYQDDEFKLGGDGVVDHVLRHFQEDGHVPDCMTWSDKKQPELHRYVRQYDPDTKKESVQREPYHPKPFNRSAELGKSRQFVPEEDRSQYYDKPKPLGEDGVADAMIWWPTTLSVHNKNLVTPSDRKKPDMKDDHHDSKDGHHGDHDHGHGKDGHHGKHGEGEGHEHHDKHQECKAHHMKCCDGRHGKHQDCQGHHKECCESRDGHNGHGGHGGHHDDHHSRGNDHHGEHHDSHKENHGDNNAGGKDFGLEKRYYGVPPSPESVRKNRDKPQSATGKNPLRSGVVISGGPQVRFNHQ